MQDLLIPEGPSRREVAPLVAKAGVPGDYLAASKRSAALNPRSYGAPRGTPSLEGFLFPATYRLKRGRDGAHARDRSSCRRSRSNTAGVSLRTRGTKNLTLLRRADHRLDGRARDGGRRASGASSPGVDLQPPEAGHPARHRRDDALRREQLDAAAHDRPSSPRDSPFNTRRARACRRRRSATPASRRSAPPRAPRARGRSSTSSSRAPTARTRSRAPTRSSRPTSRPTTASAPSSAARTRRPARSERPRRRVRSRDA